MNPSSKGEEKIFAARIVAYDLMHEAKALIEGTSESDARTK